MDICAVILTFNEESNIKACIDSVRLLTENIVVVDSGSQDLTVKIAKEAGAEVHHVDFEGFSKLRRMALSLVRSEWVIFVDADERISQRLASQIKTMLNSHQFDGFYIPRKSFFLGHWIRYCGWYPDYQLKLFKREKAHILDKLVHEGVCLPKRAKIRHICEPILHYTYPTLQSYLMKMFRYAKLSGMQFFKEKRRIKFAHFLIHPTSKFLKMYLFQKGFLGGMPCFILCLLSAFHELLKYVWLWWFSRVPPYNEKLFHIYEKN